MDGVQDILYKHLTNQPVQQSGADVEAEHLRALLRQKIAVDSTPEGLVMPNFGMTAPPPDWPVGVPWNEPGLLNHEQLLLVLKSMHQQSMHQQSMHQQQIPQ